MRLAIAAAGAGLVSAFQQNCGTALREFVAVRTGAARIVEIS